MTKVTKTFHPGYCNDIPEDEQWLFANPEVLASVERGLQQAAEMSEEAVGKQINKSKGAIKNDQGKPMFACLPPDGLMELGKVAALGATKYGMHNYRKGLGVTRLIDAAIRHLIAAMKGEENDPKDGNNHLASAAWNSLAAFQEILDHPEKDDRWEGDK